MSFKCLFNSHFVFGVKNHISFLQDSSFRFAVIILASKKYDTCAKVHNLVIRAVVIYGVFLAIVSSILFVPVKKHTTFGDVYWESLWDKVRFIDD